MKATRRGFLHSLATTLLLAAEPRIWGQDLGNRSANKEALPAVGDSPEEAGPLANDLSARMEPRDIRKAMERVGDWELSRTRSAFNDDWTFAALYAGLMAAGDSLPCSAYLDAMEKMGRQLHWQPGPDPIHADHQAVGQTYLELYLRRRNPEMLKPIRARFDQMMQRADDPRKPLWWWCDALFMAPPVCTRLYRATGEKAYLHFLDREWQITSDALYDQAEHLFYRDQRYIGKQEANGQKLFWSRGNGWVLGGLARVMQYLPRNWPSRERYETQFRQMAERLAKLQGEDGLWRSGLLNPESYPLPEVSGSGFIAYGIAWGVRQKLLDRKQYLPVAERAWKGMVGHIYQDGRLGCIQPVSAAPGQFMPTSSYVYGVGAFLLAGSELLLLHEKKSATT